MRSDDGDDETDSDNSVAFDVAVIVGIIGDVIETVFVIEHSLLSNMTNVNIPAAKPIGF